MAHGRASLMALREQAIEAKRDGRAIGKEALEAFGAGLANGEVTDSQAAALAMAICIRGMDAAETSALTDALAHSGNVIEWDEERLGGPVLDKHSSGGVGDKVSVLLAPIVAACGGFVPMVSGRGLGHTGGTLDKLEAVPGYEVEVDTKRFHEVVREVGCAIVGASPDLAPADKRLYAIRDVTCTVDSIPLITASILAKKIAAGAKRLVMDVKVGSGAFMRDADTGRSLARSIVDTAKQSGLGCVALLTGMDEPLGETAGNALEMAEVADILSGRSDGDPRLVEVTLEIAAEMLRMGSMAADNESGRKMASEAIASGAAAERLARMVGALGGDPSFVEKGAKALPCSTVQVAARPPGAGQVAEVDVRSLGLAVVDLGGGRRKENDMVDPSVGLSGLAGIGDAVGPGDGDPPLAVVHAKDEVAAQAAAGAVAAAYRVGAGGDAVGRAPVLERLS